MSGRIEVAGWEAANTIAKHLATNGYQIKIEADQAFIGQTELRYIVSFCHPVYDGGTFELIDEEFEGTRSWKDIKAELKLGEADIAEGLDHLTESAVWVAKGDTDGDVDVKKKKGKK